MLGSVTPPRIFISVLLPAPFSPMSPTTSPRFDGEADVRERPDAGIGLADAEEFEDRVGHASTRRSGAIARRAIEGLARLCAPAAERRYFLPCRSFSSAQKASTLFASMILVGMIISLFAGTTDLSPSRYLAMSFMP